MVALDDVCLEIQRERVLRAARALAAAARRRCCASSPASRSPTPGDHHARPGGGSDRPAAAASAPPPDQPHVPVLRAVPAPVRGARTSRTGWSGRDSRRTRSAHGSRRCSRPWASRRRGARPSQLSGGQRQRVALARAIVKRPRLLLLDEPLSALDRKVRAEMQLELKRLQHEVGITFVVVTHDQEEAMSMADRIAVLDHGRVQQVDAPVELYERPRTPSWRTSSAQQRVRRHRHRRRRGGPGLGVLPARRRHRSGRAGGARRSARRLQPGRTRERTA